MTAPLPDGNLPAARRRLDNAISALINPTTQLANGEHAEVPSLYQQLYDAIPGMQGIGHSAARSLPPLWLDAAKILGEIDAAARKWVPAYGYCRECRHCAQKPATVNRLEVLNERRWRPQDVRHIEDIAARIETWVIDITVLLTPEPVRALWAAEGGGFAKCPACQKTMAKKCVRVGESGGTTLQSLENGSYRCRECSTTWPRDCKTMKCARSREIVGTPALQLMKDGSTYCQACKYTWGREWALWVAAKLGYPLPEGMLQ